LLAFECPKEERRQEYYSAHLPDYVEALLGKDRVSGVQRSSDALRAEGVPEQGMRWSPRAFRASIRCTRLLIAKLDEEEGRTRYASFMKDTALKAAGLRSSVPVRTENQILQ
jgi:hypothetical protein